jgi:hypothetical protein
MSARLLLLCLLLRSSWLTLEGERHVGAARVLHRRGGPAVEGVSVGVAVGVLKREPFGSSSDRRDCSLEPVGGVWRAVLLDHVFDAWMARKHPTAAQTAPIALTRSGLIDGCVTSGLGRALSE